MSEITIQDVEHVARLAQLDLSPGTKERLVREMGEILGYMDQLNRLDTTNVEPMMHAMEMTNVFREDVVGASTPREEALRRAPVSDDAYYIVPKILDTGEV